MESRKAKKLKQWIINEGYHHKHGILIRINNYEDLEELKEIGKDINIPKFNHVIKWIESREGIPYLKIKRLLDKYLFTIEYVIKPSYIKQPEIIKLTTNIEDINFDGCVGFSKEMKTKHEIETDYAEITLSKLKIIISNSKESILDTVKYLKDKLYKDE